MLRIKNDRRAETINRSSYVWAESGPKPHYAMCHRPHKGQVPGVFGCRGGACLPQEELQRTATLHQGFQALVVPRDSGGQTGSAPGCAASEFDSVLRSCQI